MGFFERIFGKNTSKTDSSGDTHKPALDILNAQSGYENLPGFIETDSSEYQLVSVIASAIAAGDNPDSTFNIKRILKRNPEVSLVSAIAVSIAAGDSPESQFLVQKIQKKTI